MNVVPEAGTSDLTSSDGDVESEVAEASGLFLTLVIVAVVVSVCCFLAARRKRRARLDMRFENHPKFTRHAAEGLGGREPMKLLQDKTKRLRSEHVPWASADLERESAVYADGIGSGSTVPEEGHVDPLRGRLALRKGQHDATPKAGKGKKSATEFVELEEEDSASSRRLFFAQI